MTIREIEVKTGMTRPNIRFYEYEGLISPARAGNNYRDYSEEDLADLLKIKLLRQLQVPIEDIKLLQSGALALDDALGEKLQTLENDMKGLQYSADICRDIRANSYRYENLDADKYLNWIKNAEPTGSMFFSIIADALPRVKHPWRRYFARQLDFTVYAILWSAVSLLALRWNTGSSVFQQLVETYIIFLLMLFIEPLLLSTLGTTPGKWIFGLRVRDEYGNKLTYSGALLRSWRVFHYGYGYAIPFYSLYRNYKSYKICADDGELPWDEDIAYTISDRKTWRAAAFIGASALLFVITGFVFFQAEMPRHRGTLTAAEFTQNVNDLINYKKVPFYSHLDTNGRWTEDPNDITYVLFGLPRPDFQITETNGEITKISFEATSDKKEILSDSLTPLMILAVKFYVCAQRGENLISQFSVIPQECTAFTNFEYTRSGITVKNSVTYEGYQLFRHDVLSPIESEKQYFHMEFSMEKTG